MGTQVGQRHVSADLTGPARAKFDVAGQRPQRWRMLYRELDNTTGEVIAIGMRDQHAIYRD